MRPHRRPFLSMIALLLATSLPAASFATESPELTSDERMQIMNMWLSGNPAQAVDFLEKRIGEAEPTSMQLYELCNATMRASLYGKMIPCLDKLVQRKSADGRVVIQSVDFTSAVYSMMATGYTRVGDYEKAIAAAKRVAENVDRKGSPEDIIKLVDALSVLGYAQAKRGEKEPARETARKLASLDLTALPFDEFNREIGKRSGLLRIYIETGDFAQALEVFEQTEPRYSAETDQLMTQTMGAAWKETKAFVSMTRGLQRGQLLLGVGRIAEARQSFDASLADPRSAHIGEFLAYALYDRGRIAAREGKPAEAIDFYRRAVDVIESVRSSIGSEAAKIAFVGNKQDVYGHLVAALIAAKRPGEAFEYAERAKARALVDMLASREKFGRPQGARGVAANEVLPVLTQLNADLAKFDPAKATQEQLQKNQQTRGLVRKTAEKLQQADYELASLVTATSFSEARLRELLQPDETLVEYYYFGTELYAFVATKSTLRAVRLEGGGLSEAVHQFRNAVQDPRSKDIATLSQALHGRLIAPLGLPAKGALVVVPHGVLHYLPFNALASRADAIIDRYSLRLLPSASVMSFLNQRKATGKGMIIFGNPDLGDPQFDLPGAQKEAAEIARLRPGSTLLMRGAATKTAAKNLAGNFAYLHFASHGKFQPGKPLQSGIYLAADKDTGSNGTLTVDELYSLDLNADLVTLSACETALGSIDNGDDVVGLTRGFFYAGVSSIVSSLWPVDDDATFRMMTSFYPGLEKSSKAEALRKAQLAVKAKQPHPYYWAAFQLTGNRK